jgi:MFS family permease
MIYPLLPAFVTGTLKSGAAALGALDGAAELASAAAKFVTGRLADRRERRGPLIVLGYLVAVLVRPLIAFTTGAWQVIGLRVTDRIGKGVRTPARDALIADVTPPDLHGRAFGLQRGLDHAGAVIGPVAAWILLSTAVLDVRGVIAASIIPGVLVLTLAMWAVRGGGGGSRMVEDGGGRIPTSTNLHHPPPSSTILLVTLFYLSRLPETLLILRTQQLGVAVASVTLLWAALHVVRSATSFVGGRMADRFGPWRTMRVGWLAWAGLVALLAVVESAPQAAAVFLATGVVAGLTESPERALVARLAGTRTGSGFGGYHAATGVAALIGGVGLGLVFQEWSGATACLASGGLVALLALASLTFARPEG